MPKLAGLLLLLAFLCDLFAGLGYIGLGTMGVEVFAMLGTVGESLASMAGAAGQPSSLTGLVATPGGALVAIGVAIATVAFLALIAATRLLRARPGMVVYAGAALAFVVDLVSATALGFNLFQIPGLLGGSLGLYAEHALSTTDAARPGPPRAASARGSPLGALFAIGAILLGFALIALAVYWEFLRPAGPAASRSQPRTAFVTTASPRQTERPARRAARSHRTG